jgi:hypothetical protein
MPKDNPPKQARLFSFATGKPIDDDPSIAEALDILSRIAGRAMETGADPSALVSPDHNLLLCCDALVMLNRQRTQLQDRWRALPINHPDREKLDAECDVMKRPIYKLLLRISKLEAQTASGIFAKAGAVSRSGYTAVGLGQSLARDLLNSPELRRVVWPAADRGGADG